MLLDEIKRNNKKYNKANIRKIFPKIPTRNTNRETHMAFL